MGPEIALEMAWETLDNAYYTSQSPAQHLLKQFTQGPKIISNHASALVMFSKQCKSAQKLILSISRAIPSLEDRQTMNLSLIHI